MANELTITHQAVLRNGNNVFIHQPGAVQITQTAAGGPVPGVITVGTTEETVSLSELSTYGWCEIRNLDTTNFVDFGFSTTVYGIRVKAGEIASFRLKPGCTLYAKSDTAACKVAIYALEN